MFPRPRKHPSRLRFFLFLLLAGGIIGTSQADQLVLINGDVITGTILSLDDKVLKMATPYGQITVERSQIARGSFGEPRAEQTGEVRQSSQGNLSQAEITREVDQTVATLKQVMEGETPAVTTQPAQPEPAQTPAAETEPPARGLVLHLPFNSTTIPAGGSSRETARPLMKGNLTYQQDRRGRKDGALVSQGKGDFLEIPPTPALNELQEFTLALWIQGPPPEAGKFLLSQWTSSSGEKAVGKVSLRINNQAVYAYLVDDTGRHHTLAARIPPPGFTREPWHHIALTHREGRVVLYMDGQKLTENQFSFSHLMNDEAPLHILTAQAGSSGNWKTYNYPGAMDDLVIYNRELPPEEIKNLAQF